MRETAILIEVPEAEPYVASWRDRFDPVAAWGIPAHVTVLFPFVSPTELDAAVIAQLREVALSQPAFEFRLASLDEFPGVVWLRPDPDQPFRALTRAVWAAFPQYPPYRGTFPDSQPHLTVAMAATPTAQPALRRELDETLANRLPVDCVASAMSVFTSDETGRWTRAFVLALGG
jgi:2'-5' RNA ligase